MFSEYTSLAVNSFTSALAIYLTFKIYKLAIVLKNNINTYDFGSTAWWHWMQHVLATALCFVGSLGLSIVHVSSALDKVHDHEGSELVANGFITLILLAVLLLVNHMREEETPGSLIEHSFSGEYDRRKNVRKSTRRCLQRGSNAEL